MRTFVLLLMLLLVTAVSAKVEIHSFDSPEQEALYKSLIGELRCLVCQNQNIADSNAELALDLRAKTYTLVKQGKSEDEIVAYMVERYGDFVMYRPPLKSTTIFLWAGPFILLLAAVVFVLLFVRRKRHAEQVSGDEAMLKQARDLLEERQE